MATIGFWYFSGTAVDFSNTLKIKVLLWNLKFYYSNHPKVSF